MCAAHAGTERRRRARAAQVLPFVSLLLCSCVSRVIRNAPSLEARSSANLRGYGIRSVAVRAVGYEGWRPELREKYERAAGAHDNDALAGLALQYADYQRSTPSLTAPSYPLERSKDQRIAEAEREAEAQVSSALRAIGYEAAALRGSDGDVADALDDARRAHFDAVLLVRFFAIDEYLVVGPGAAGDEPDRPLPAVLDGLGLVPTVELYDARSRHRVYYAYKHCNNDLMRPGAEQVCRRLFKQTGPDLARRAATALAEVVVAAPSGVPQRASEGRDEEGVGQDAHAAEDLFWSRRPWDRMQITALSLGPRVMRMDASAALGDDTLGGATLAGVRVTSVYAHYRNIGMDVGTVDLMGGRASNDRRVGYLGLGWVGLRYMLRLSSRIAPFLGARVTTFCSALDNGDRCSHRVTGPVPFAGVRFETWLPVDLAFEYAPAVASLGLSATFHPLGIGTRPYPRGDGEVDVW